MERCVDAFVEDFIWDCDVEIDNLRQAEPQATDYIQDRKSKLFKRDILKKMFTDLNARKQYERECNYRKKIILPATSFFDMNKYLDDCEMDFDGVYYNYSLNWVISMLESDRFSYMENAVEKLVEEGKKIYMDAVNAYCDSLEKKLEEIFKMNLVFFACFELKQIVYSK